MSRKRLKQLLLRMFTWGNSVALITISVGALASFGLLDRFADRNTLLLAVATLLATQMLVDRVSVLSDVRQTLSENRRYQVLLRPRTDPGFQRFSDFARNAREILVVGIDLGFLATADGFFIPQALSRGVNVKLLISDPSSAPAVASILDNHDERNVTGKPAVHRHLITAAETLEVMRSFSEASNAGSLEVRARVDIPSPSVTMVDPREPQGVIRVEIKPYKNNHGEVPYLELDRSSIWYEIFFDRYYQQLWRDSPVLLESKQSGFQSPVAPATAGPGNADPTKS